MARIAGVALPPNKRAQIGMTYIYGVGRSRATEILGQAGISIDAKIKDLSEADLNKIRTILAPAGDIEGDLRKRVQMDIKRLMDIGAIAGLDIVAGCRFRGQRTSTNARTRKGRAKQPWLRRRHRVRNRRLQWQKQQQRKRRL